MTNGALTTLRIEVDGHFHGSSDVPRPWVAQITGIDRKYGLARTFVDQLRDYAGAKRSCAGRLNGVVACFPLREGNLYEVSRLRGSSSKRHLAREFVLIEDGKRQQVESIEALETAERLAGAPGHAGPTIEYRAPDSSAVSIALVRGIGTPHPLGWVVSSGTRLYRLRIGDVHEISEDGRNRLALVDEHGPSPISQLDALKVLLTKESP